MTLTRALAKAGLGAGLVGLATAAGLIATAGTALAGPGPLPLFDVFSGIQNSSSTSILGVVNRPSSPVVTGLATDTQPNTCGIGLWGRGGIGTIETSGDYPMTANYGGPSGGIDYGCSDINGTGLDLRIGVTGGVSGGKATAEGIDGSVTYSSAMYGVYVSFAKDGWAGDLQVMGDHTEYSADGLYPYFNDGVALTSDQVALSGYLGYTLMLGDGMQLTPYAGFSVSRTTTSKLTFADTSTAEIDPQVGKIAYVGAALAKTFILDDQISALQPFVSATYYADFSDDSVLTYESTEFPLTTSGGFGEVSAGINYVKLLNGEMGSAKQFTGTARLDGRFSDGFKGAALTVQGRLQF